MTARVVFLGDTLLGSKAQPTLDREGYGYALDGLRPLLDGADLVVANHEGPVSADAPAAAKTYGPRNPAWRRAEPESLTALAAAGVRLVGLGNNHVLDHGDDGLRDTLTHLDAAGIAHCGAGPDAASAGRGVDVSVAGETLHVVSAMETVPQRLAAGCYAGPGRAGPALLEPAVVAAGLSTARGLRVVLPHWGQGYGPVEPGQRRLATELVVAGAQLVVGTGAHTPQPVQLVDGVPVLFALGNGAYGSRGRFRSTGAPPYGMVATVEVSAGRVCALEVRLLLVDNRIVDFRPRPAPDGAALAVLRGLLDPAVGWSTVDGGYRCELGG